MLLRTLHRSRKRSFNVLWKKKTGKIKRAASYQDQQRQQQLLFFSFRVFCGNSFIITSRTKIVWSALLAVSLRKYVQFKGCSSFAASRRK